MLCDERGNAIGVEPKSSVHHADTPLHLAFSCYVFSTDGQILVTRRASAKMTWPGVRTNSCCGHPAPGEPLPTAITRRLRDELGVLATSVQLILPTFRYRATMSNGVVENELCPVYRAVVTDLSVTPNPDEVDAAWWQPWTEFLTPDPRDPLSPWSVQQVAALSSLGPDPSTWPVADSALLPGAAVN